MEEFNNDQLNTTKIQKSGYSDNGSVAKPEEYGSLKKAKRVSKVTTTLLTIVGAGLVLGSIISFSFTYKPTAVIEQFDLEAETTAINYDIVIKNMDTETLTLKIHNQFISRTETIIMGRTLGSFTELTPGMQYQVSIIEKDVLVKSQNITTLLH